MKRKQFRYFVGDFETTVYKGQTKTEVWASAIVELGTEDVIIFHSLPETMDFLLTIPGNLCIYYHNLKFDGAFLLDYFIAQKGVPQALYHTGDGDLDLKFYEDQAMPGGTIKYSISHMGQFYSITYHQGGRFIEFRDSLKLLPFSVKTIGESFQTKHRKLAMEYEGERYAGCTITPEEKEYIANDVLVVKEALEFMFSQGHDRLTIGSCCLNEFQTECNPAMDYKEYKAFFPNLSHYPIDPEDFGSSTVDEYVRKAYRGAWCYLVDGKKGIHRNGTTADVNSLYPSVMHSESGSKYPVGDGQMFKFDSTGRWPQLLGTGENLDFSSDPEYFYFIRFSCRFEIREGYLPFIQIKGNPLYCGNECLKTSDFYSSKEGKYYRYWTSRDGTVHDTRVTLTMTWNDFELFREHYIIKDLELHDGCRFYAEYGLFDKYIDKYREIKIHSKGAVRTLAKLFLNNLYGKLATSTNSSFKIARSVEGHDGLKFYTIDEHDKNPVYIPAGAAITSYARCFTVRAAQKNFHGVDKPGFIYADTDSIHCDLPPEEIKGITVHPTNFCCWKLESCWDVAYFTRQKTYIEHVTHEDLEEIEHPYYNIKCAGMPENCKRLFELSLLDIVHKEEKTEEEKKEIDELTDEEYEFVKTKRELKDFDIGLKVPSKLLAKRISGGVILVPTTFEMR